MCVADGTCAVVLGRVRVRSARPEHRPSCRGSAKVILTSRQNAEARIRRQVTDREQAAHGLVIDLFDITFGGSQMCVELCRAPPVCWKCDRSYAAHSTQVQILSILFAVSHGRTACAGAWPSHALRQPQWNGRAAFGTRRERQEAGAWPTWPTSACGMPRCDQLPPARGYPHPSPGLCSSCESRAPLPPSPPSATCKVGVGVGQAPPFPRREPRAELVMLCRGFELLSISIAVD